MKKILLVVFLLGTLCSHAQKYYVGQVVPQGTWSALVVYVDETGEHGLLMSPTALREGTLALKFAAKHAKMSVEDFIAQYPVPLMAKGEKDSKVSKVMKEMMKQNLNGTKGEENCQNIAEYCENNGIMMDAYFPEVTWASSLGEGWFIPGVDELELYSKVIAKGVGKKNYKGDLLHSDKHRQELNKEITERFKNGEAENYIQFPSYIGSSTFACNSTFEKDPANKEKIAKINGLSILGNIDYIYFGLALFSNQYGQCWYVFNKKGVDYQPYTNAFKRF